MKLRLLDMNEFIRAKNCLEITNSRYPTVKGYDPDGLWSEKIFGRVGSRQRKNTFGYISLKTKFISPVIFKMIRTTAETFSRICYKKKKYIVENELFIENDEGETGVAFLIKNLDKVDVIKLANPDKKDIAEYIVNNMHKILIDKFIILPAGDRDIDIRDLNKSISLSSPINNTYQNLLNNVKAITGDEIYDINAIENVQNNLVAVVDFLRNNFLRGKSGVIRNNVMKKTVDFSSRLVLTSSPNVEIGTVVIPWHTLLTIFEPITTYHLFKPENKDLLDKIAKFTKKNNISVNDIVDFLDNLVKYLETFPQDIKEELKKLAEVVVKDQVVICKRDPAQQRNQWFCAKPIPGNGRAAVFNNIDLHPLGGDCDGDCVGVYPLLTEEAKKDAIETMDPTVSRSKHIDIKNHDSFIYNLALDNVFAIYEATRE